MNDRTAESVESAIVRLGGGERLIAAPPDLAAPDGPSEAIGPALRLGKLDALINNAG